MNDLDENKQRAAATPTRLAMTAAMADGLTIERAAARLRLEPSVVHARVRAGQLAASTDGTTVRLPVWQFFGRHTVLGLSIVLERCHDAQLDVTIFATTRHPDLAGLCPADDLKRGGILRVLKLFDQLHSHNGSST